MPKGVYKRTEKHGKAISVGINRPEVKIKHSASCKIAQNRPETKAGRIAATKKRFENPAEREKQSILMQEVMNRPEIKSKMPVIMREINDRIEVREKHRIITIKQWAIPESRKNLKEALNRPEVRLKKSIRNTGENNPAWRGGISKEPYAFEFSEKLKESIRKRDNYTCQICKLTQEQVGCTLSVHHIDYDKKNSSGSNLVSLCNSCHGVTGGNREYWTKVFNGFMAELADAMVLKTIF